MACLASIKDERSTGERRDVVDTIGVSGGLGFEGLRGLVGEKNTSISSFHYSKSYREISFPSPLVLKCDDSFSHK